MSTPSGDDERVWSADKRDFVADRRDEVADERDRVAAARDQAANSREAERSTPTASDKPTPEQLRAHLRHDTSSTN